MPRGIICDRGFKILGTPLAFKNAKNPGLLFYADLDMTIPRGTKRVIGTALVMNALNAKHRNIDAIAVGYDRMFKLGNMELKLLPSGMGPGTALLEIKFKNKSILYTAGLRSAKSLSGEQVQPVHSDILLVDYAVSEHKSPAPKTAKAELLKWIHSHRAAESGIAPALMCGNRTSVFEALAAVADLDEPVIAHRSVYNLLRDTGVPFLAKHAISRMERKWPIRGIVLLMHSTFAGGRYRTDHQIPRCFCGPHSLAPPDAMHIPFGEREHVRGLIKFAKQCNVHTVAISSIANEHTAAAFRKAGFDVFYSKIPEQLTLPL
ncbi:MAG: hypothetical protein JXX29_23120 [Deltaproteobacteria bacterium]|nr:hypothetical protein [Deltaproteobacteria bacterium]MBN2674592.1 hypothetical protein [Deltaproteobacteria bacterium]